MSVVDGDDGEWQEVGPSCKLVRAKAGRAEITRPPTFSRSHFLLRRSAMPLLFLLGCRTLRRYRAVQASGRHVPLRVSSYRA
jgi:hypothetical protein